MSTLNDKLPARIREAKRAARQPWKVIAHASGYSERYIQRVMAGNRMNPTLAFVDAMATALNVSPFWLLGSDP